MTAFATAVPASAFDANRRPISTQRPRLLGTREQLVTMSKEQSDAYRRMVDYARRPEDPAFYELNAKIIGLAILYVVEGDCAAGREAVDLVLKHYIDKPIQAGHVTFAHSMARCAIAYDLCHDLWTPEER